MVYQIISLYLYLPGCNARFLLRDRITKVHYNIITELLPPLTHLSRLCFPIPINWTSPFPILGLLGGILANSGGPIRRLVSSGFALFADVPIKGS